jgi:hypothetical protein
MNLNGFFSDNHLVLLVFLRQKNIYLETCVQSAISKYYLTIKRHIVYEDIKSHVRTFSAAKIYFKMYYNMSWVNSVNRHKLNCKLREIQCCHRTLLK